MEDQYTGGGEGVAWFELMLKTFNCNLFYFLLVSYLTEWILCLNKIK